jgi:DNA polymerase III subunit epsilon
MLAFLTNLQKKRLKDRNFEFLFDKNENNEMVVFDTETTGLNPKKDEIISIGAIKIKENKILMNKKFHIFIKPKEDINEQSIKIHQIRNIDIQDAYNIQKGVESFLHFIGSRPLIGYHLQFDVAMINKYINPLLGITLPNRQIEVAKLYRKKRANKALEGFIDLSFDAIMKDLSLPIFGKHDAINDSIMTAMIYIKLKYGKIE